MVIILKRENSIKFWAVDISVSGLAWDGRWPERGRLFLRLRNSEVEFQGQASKPGRAGRRSKRSSLCEIAFVCWLSPAPGAVRVWRGRGPPPDNHWAGALRSVAKWKLGQGSAELGCCLSSRLLPTLSKRMH